MDELPRRHLLQAGLTGVGAAALTRLSTTAAQAAGCPMAGGSTAGDAGSR